MRDRPAAINAEILYSNHILRILMEFEPYPESQVPPIPELLSVVKSIGPNQYVPHLVDPRRPLRRTFCGLDAGAWADLGETRQEAGRTVYGPVCRNCAHALDLAVNN